MIVIVCVDDKLGMMFNNRRQSKDVILSQKILDIIGDEMLLMGSYSSSLFPALENILVDDDFLQKAKANEYCFVEDRSLSPIESKIEKIIMFRWNCVYPHDITLDIDLKSWKLISSADFTGKSHEKITMEVFQR